MSIIMILLDAFTLPLSLFHLVAETIYITYCYEPSEYETDILHGRDLCYAFASCQDTVITYTYTPLDII